MLKFIIISIGIFYLIHQLLRLLFEVFLTIAYKKTKESFGTGYQKRPTDNSNNEKSGEITISYKKYDERPNSSQGEYVPFKEVDPS